MPKNLKDSTRYTLTLGDRGRLVIPADVRARLGLKSGDTLALRLNRDGSMTLLSLEERTKSAQGLYADISPVLSLADDLIAERRLEAVRELNGIFAKMEPEGNWSDEIIEARREDARREALDG